jgi:hypothetical protein
VPARQPGPDAPVIAEAKLLTRPTEGFDREVLRCCARLEGVPTELLQALQSISASSLLGQPVTSQVQFSEDCRLELRWLLTGSTCGALRAILNAVVRLDASSL